MIWLSGFIPPILSLSTIIASDKATNKLFVYELDGNTLQIINISGKPGNIDIRYNFNISGQPTDIVGFNDRTNQTIVFYEVDPSTRELSFISNFPSGTNYGFCLYSSSITEKYYAFSSNKSSRIRQFELSGNSGSITGSLVREWYNGSGLTEGMVADEETGKLYCANESEGIYKYDAEPIDPNPVGVKIAATGENGLTSDVEGLTLYYAANGEGYLIASSQGSDDFKVYERKGSNSFVKTIKVEGVGKTDGIDVTNLNLGSPFLEGIFLAHDGTGSPYSIKVCKYEDLGLTVDVSFWNPRDYPLPVELTYFAGTLNGNNVELRWRTETEVNNYGFEIERTSPLSPPYQGGESKAGGGWEKIGFVAGHGNSNSPKLHNFIDTDINQSGTYYYRLKQIDNDGTYEYSDVVSVEVGVPNKFYLSQNYPNPFNPETRIDFTIPEKQLVTIRIYNTLGEQVAELINEEREAGSYSATFDASNLSSGVYIYRLQTPRFTSNKKMILLS